MSTTMRALAWVAGLGLALGLALSLWVERLARDDGGVGRPTHGAYTWPAPASGEPGAGGAIGERSDDDPRARALPQTPRGGPVPRADGYVMGSLGNDFILPPMPPERSTDIARRDNVFANNAIRNCFWPGPKLRTGYYTTDPDDYGLENQFPDIGNTFSTAWFRIPAGGRIVMKGEFPHLRHWSFVTYTADGVPRDGLADVEIHPDPGSSNPYRRGVRRDVDLRRYTLSIVNGNPPDRRPRNTIYTLAEPGDAIGMHMRNYVPDRSIDWTGGVGVPEVELHLADGTVLKDAQACAATHAPLRGKQVPLTVSKGLWMALNRLPWRPADRTPARDFDVAPMVKFYNREHLILQTFFPALPSDALAVEKGGFWSNPATRYGFTYLSQAYGKVYVVHGRMPSTPSTWHGDGAPMAHDADMRYWSLCTSTAPPVGNTVDCVTDENVRPVIDRRGAFNVVVSRAPDRPANATEHCGVVWMEYGNGDGIPGGSQDFGVVINRHTQVNPGFSHSWFDVRQGHGEAEAMGPYLPHVINLRDRARFEALGCPVDTERLAAMARP
ncbi:hypothetical protein [Ideonella sp. A 288]|uniref:hypothetical protein n=1 Tax=Ideonella sp. A 288 TaxID=1962181 RepID=UPI000B4B3F90|nr:hypothetical protein [Ideonella sp. A 288]